jgi:hypothetical protein
MKNPPSLKSRIRSGIISSVISFAALAASSVTSWSAPTAQNTDFAYVLTTQSDPAKPGESVPFAITVTNLSNADKQTEISFVVPDHLYVGGYRSGRTYTFSNMTVAPGDSRTLDIVATIESGASAPADGTQIELFVRDLNRSTSVSRSIEVQSAREEELKLSKSVGSVAPGARFTYTLAYHNGRPSPIAMAQLRLPVPVGATFVSADAGGTVSNGVVRWALGNLADAQTGQVEATFTASPSGKAPLLLDATLLDSANQVLAQASDAMTIDSTPAFSYALSTQDDTVKPGGNATFTITVTNRTNSTQSADISLVVPYHSFIGGYRAGRFFEYSRINLAAGASRSLAFTPTIESGADSPTDGSLVNFIVRDRERGAAVSRTIVVQSLPVADLKLSTQGGTVAPLGNFTCSLSYHNQSPATIGGAKLSLPVPAGATFVSADGGGVLAGGVVQWSLGNLADALNGQVKVTFTAPQSTHTPMLLEAKLRNAANQVLAHASEVKTVVASPAFSYALSTQNDTARPGESVPYTITITNLTNSTQSSNLSLVVPNHAAIGGYRPGRTYEYGSLSLPAGASRSVTFTPTIYGSADTPPDGAIINFVVRDHERGAAVSRRIVVQSEPKADLKLSTKSGTVSPGGVFSYVLTYHNSGITAVAGTRLELPVPKGAVFVAANGGGKLVNGVLSWGLGDTAPGATYKVQADFKAPASDLSALLFHAQLLNGSNQILAEASEIKSIQAFPAFAYELVAETLMPIPGGGVSYMLKVSNLTNSTQNTNLSFAIPFHTYFGGYRAGRTYEFGSLTVASRSSTSVPITLTVPDGSDAPIDGTIINLVVQDLERGASVSHTLAVNRTVGVYGTATRILELGGNLKFGKVALGKLKSRSLIIRNRGNAPLTVSKISLPKGFTGSFSGVIPAGGERRISVAFKPSVARLVSGRLTVFSDKTAGTESKAISGAGASRVLVLGGKLNFGTVTKGTSKRLNLTIRNAGNTPLAVTRLALPKGYKGSFRGIIKPGATKRIRVTFRPTAARKYAGKLVVFSNKTNGANSMRLSGRGGR